MRRAIPSLRNARQRTAAPRTIHWAAVLLLYCRNPGTWATPKKATKCFTVIPSACRRFHRYNCTAMYYWQQSSIYIHPSREHDWCRHILRIPATTISRCFPRVVCGTASKNYSTAQRLAFASSLNEKAPTTLMAHTDLLTRRPKMQWLGARNITNQCAARCIHCSPCFLTRRTGSGPSKRTTLQQQ